MLPMMHFTFQLSGNLSHQNLSLCATFIIFKRRTDEMHYVLLISFEILATTNNKWHSPIITKRGPSQSSAALSFVHTTTGHNTLTKPWQRTNCLVTLVTENSLQMEHFLRKPPPPVPNSVAMATVLLLLPGLSVRCYGDETYIIND